MSHHKSSSQSDYETSLISGNINIFSKRTSVRLESEMWDALETVAKREKCSIHDIATFAYLRKKAGSSLTSAIRVYLLLYFQLSEGGTGAADFIEAGRSQMLAHLSMFNTMIG